MLKNKQKLNREISIENKSKNIKDHSLIDENQIMTKKNSTKNSSKNSNLKNLTPLKNIKKNSFSSQCNNETLPSDFKITKSRNLFYKKLEKKKENEKIIELLNKSKKSKIPYHKKELNISAIKPISANEQKKNRLDKNGVIINKKNKKLVHITFIDNIENNKLINVIPIESYKEFNIINDMNNQNKISLMENKCCFIY